MSRKEPNPSAPPGTVRPKAPSPPAPPKVVNQSFADLYRENIRLTAENNILEKELKRLRMKFVVYKRF